MRSAFVVVAAMTAVVVVQPLAGQICGQWEPGLGPDGAGGGIAGTDGPITSIVSWDPDGEGPVPEYAVASGRFRIAGTSVVGESGSGTLHGLATWDGSTWAAFPGSLPPEVPRYPLKLLGTNESTLIGTVRRHSSSVVVLFADGSWSQVGGPFTGDNFTIDALAVGDGELVVAGGFSHVDGQPANNVARWDGSTWVAMASGLAGGRVSTLAVHDGEVVAGGNFTHTAETPLLYVARWNGEQWSPIGGGAPFPVKFLVSVDTLLLATRVNFAGDNGIAVWSDQAWVVPPPLPGNYYPYQVITNIAVHEEAPVVVGLFRGPGGVPAVRSCRWTDQAWVPFGQASPVTHVATNVQLTVREGELLAATSGINPTLDYAVAAVRRFSEGDWSPAGDGFDGTIHHLLGIGDGRVMAVGTFTGVGGRLVRGVAEWDGAAWLPMDAGLPAVNPNNPAIIGVTLYNGSPVVVGSFSSVGGNSAVRSVATWDGETWGPVGQPGEFGTQVATGTGMYQGDLIVSMLTGPYNAYAHRLRRFDGESWSTIPGDLATPSMTKPLRIVQFGPDLVIAGDITSAAGVSMRGVARWNGQEWRPMGDGLSPGLGLVEIQLIDGVLHASVLGRVYRWSGSDWQEVVLAGFLGQYIRAMASHEGQLWVSSQLLGFGRADESRWVYAGGERMQPGPRAILALGNDIVVGGEFMRISDGRAVAVIGRWSSTPSHAAITPIEPSAHGRTGGLARVEFTFGGSGPHSVTRVLHNGTTIPINHGARASTSILQSAMRLTLVLQHLALEDAGEYIVTISNGCGEAVSAPVMLTVQCAADFDADGTINILDLFQFLDAWFAGDSAANFDGNHLIDVHDLFGWLVAWMSGC